MGMMADSDPLILLREAIKTQAPYHPTASSDPASPRVELAQATHLAFPTRGIALPIATPTRFISNDKPFDLRSIYFAWLNRDQLIPQYNAEATALNESLGDKGKVQNLGYIEKLDLITWLEGAESEYIVPLAGGEAAAAGGEATATKAGAAASTARAGKGTLDPRLASVYNGERKMGDRNTVLRGIKPTDFSHVRKLAASFLTKKSQSAPTSTMANPTTSSSSKVSGRRPDPIILLSPSASALLRLNNIRSFLQDGRFTPADTAASTASMLHVQRSMPSIDPNRPLRFILVEGPEQFKPEYWNRVVAVFTTGQTWQFKNYKWSSPNELFKHVLGVYVGWRGDAPPDNVKDWGHRVVSTAVDRWRGDGHDASRFRDKEITEQIWKAIEVAMVHKGWRKDAAPSSI